jgi:AraC family transcriptional regulator
MPRQQYVFVNSREALWQTSSYAPAASSHPLEWKELHALRFRELPSSEIDLRLPMHALIMVTRPPEKMDLRHEGSDIKLQAPVGAITIVPAESLVRWRWMGLKDSFHVYLEPGLVRRVGMESLGLNPTQIEIPPLRLPNIPDLRAAMLAINSELNSGGGDGGLLMSGSLANILAVHLLRYIVGPRSPVNRRDGVLERRRLDRVVEFIMENLDGGPTLEKMASIANLSPYHFARQFKAATGLAPHQYLIARRVERAQQLLQGLDNIVLADIAQRVGFSDQSQFSFHFKRIVGLTPRQFWISARNT